MAVQGDGHATQATADDTGNTRSVKPSISRDRCIRWTDSAEVCGDLHYVPVDVACPAENVTVLIS